MLTISPDLLAKIGKSDATVPQRLDAAEAAKLDLPKVEMNQSVFRWMLNEDAMATEKLAEGIRSFAADLEKLRAVVSQKIDG